LHYAGGDRSTIGDRVGSFAPYVENSGQVFNDYDTAKADGRTAAVAKGVAADGVDYGSGDDRGQGRGLVRDVLRQPEGADGILSGLHGLIKYSPDQPRDDHGRFGSGGAPSVVDEHWDAVREAQGQKIKDEQEASMQKQLRDARDREADAKWNAAQDKAQADYNDKVLRMQLIADSLGQPRNKINFSAEDRTFELDGKKYHYAGAADLATGEIYLYPNHISSDDETMRGIVGHEIGHVHFETVTNKYEADTRGPHELDADGRRGARRATSSTPRARSEMTLRA
jgi:hypothetical protein